MELGDTVNPPRCSCCGEILWPLDAILACFTCDGMPAWPRFARPPLFDQDADQ